MCHAPVRRREGPFHLYEWSGRSVRHINRFCKIMRLSARCARRAQTHGAYILLLLMNIGVVNMDVVNMGVVMNGTNTHSDGGTVLM